MNRTPLFEGHVAQQARLVDFAGWEMPIQYSGVLDEYQSVRQAAGLFDVSHMGRFMVTGSGASSFLQRVTTNNVTALKPNQAQYSLICQEQGGILDDIFIYRLGEQTFLLCVNASNRKKILTWLQKHGAGVENLSIQDQSEELAQLALQGPRARTIFSQLNIPDISSLPLRHCRELHVRGMSCLVARTGYTGEFGYEIYIPANDALTLWELLLSKGTSLGLKPAGLGSRDLLRLEMAYPLYGNDISEETTPLEAGLGWAVDLQKGEFIGSSVLAHQQADGFTKRLIGFELQERGVPRHGFSVASPDDHQQTIGEVTSGNFSPILQKGIGMAYVPPAYRKEGTPLTINIRGKAVPALVVKPPFYRKKPS